MISDEELFLDVISVAEELESIPTRREYEEHGNYSHSTVTRRFGSWNNCMLRLFGDVNNRQNIRKEDLISEINRLGEKLGRTPVQSDMDSDGIYNPDTYWRKFESWKKAVKKAGFDPVTRGLKCGSNHPDWKGGTTDYYHPNWEDIREKIVERDGNKCMVCGNSETRLCVHHIKPRSEFCDGGEYNYDKACEERNLVTVCNSCHMKFEGKYTNSNYKEFAEEASKDLSCGKTNT